MAINSPRGTVDIYGEDILYRDFVLSTVRELFRMFNFEELITPVFEYTEVFARSIGESTGDDSVFLGLDPAPPYAASYDGPGTRRMFSSTSTPLATPRRTRCSHHERSDHTGE